MRFVVVLPGMEIETRYARSVLPETIALKDAAGNWANAAALTAAVARGNVADFGRAVVDRVVEPVRAKLIPGFAEVKKAALDSGAHAISAFAVQEDGSLAPIAGLGGLPASAVGLAAQ